MKTNMISSRSATGPVTLMCASIIACMARLASSVDGTAWAIGAQAYTFKEFTAFEAIAKTKEAGGNVIEFFPGQALKPGSPDKVGHTMSETAMTELKTECDRVGVRPVNYGVVGAKDADEVRAIMSFAKKMGLYAVCTESTELIAAWEANAKEFDMKVAFHEHENDWMDSVPQVRADVDFVKAHAK